MKWEVKYTVEIIDGTKTDYVDKIKAGSLREAALIAHATFVRPIKQSSKLIANVEIWSLRMLEHT